MRHQASLERAKLGKPRRKSKKLYQLEGITLPDGSACTVPDDMGKHIQRHFASKWSSGKEDAHCELLHKAFAAEGISPDFTHLEMRQAFQNTRNKTKFDNDGVAIYAMELFARAQPSAFLKWLNRVAACTAEMSSVTVSGMPAGKSSTKPTVANIRMILPQNSFLTLLDLMVSNRLHVLITQRLPLCPADGFYVGALPRTQTMDVAHTLQLVVDKAGDLQGNGCIAQADICQYYDNLPLARLANWLLLNGCNPATVAVCVRQQALANVCICVRDANCTLRIQHRAVGGLTGSRVAGALGRICVEETFYNFKEKWLRCGFQNRAVAGSWVDNVYVLSDSPQKAVQILKEAESHLRSKWSLSFKPSSKSLMPVHSCTQNCADPEYRTVCRFDALGHVLTSTGSCQMCFNETINAAWRQFWHNVSPKCRKKFPVQYRLDSLTRFVKPIIVYRCARWPFSKHKARQLDIIQRKMLRIICDIKRLDDEAPETFSRRSARLVAETQRNQTCWSKMWAQNVVMWAAHIIRNTNGTSWPAQLLSVQSSTALREARAFNANRPGTRNTSGFLPTRWTDGVATAIQVLTPFTPKVRLSIEEACHRHFSVNMHGVPEEHLIANFLSFL